MYMVAAVDCMCPILKGSSCKSVQHKPTSKSCFVSVLLPSANSNLLQYIARVHWCYQCSQFYAIPDLYILAAVNIRGICCRSPMLQGSYAAGVHLWVSAAQANQYFLLYHGNSANSDVLKGSMYVPVQHKPKSNLCAIPASYKAAAVDDRGPATGVCAAVVHLYVSTSQ